MLRGFADGIVTAQQSMNKNITETIVSGNKIQGGRKMYNQLTPEIIEQIKGVCQNVFLGEDINPDYAKDEMPIYGTHMPDMAVQPRSTEEVAAVMKICYDNNIPVTPRGAGTGLAGGAVPLYGGVLIDISKMNKIISYDMEKFRG